MSFILAFKIKLQYKLLFLLDLINNQSSSLKTDKNGWDIYIKEKSGQFH